MSFHIKRAAICLWMVILLLLSGRVVASAQNIEPNKSSVDNSSTNQIFVHLKGETKASSMLSVASSLPDAEYAGGIPNTRTLIYKVDGDVEKAVHQVGQHGTVGLEHPRDLAGIFLESGDILAREVEDTGGRFLIGLRNGEDLAEGGHLVAGNKPVGLGHLGAERDHGNGETDRAFGRFAQAVEHRAKPFTGGEGRQGIADTGPKGHGAVHSPDARKM